MSKGSQLQRLNSNAYRSRIEGLYPPRMTNKQWRNVWYVINDFIKLKQGEKDAA